MHRYKVYVGSYTSNGGKGISVYDMDGVTGELRLIRSHPGVVNPSYLALSPDRKNLYAVNEVSAYYGQPDGSVSAFAIGADGDVGFLNQRSTSGGSPCHLALDRTGKILLVANYGGGGIATFAVQGDGKIGPQVSCKTPHGLGTGTGRQAGPHPHCIGTDPGNKNIWVADLGLDQITQHAFDPDSGEIRSDGTTLDMPAGSGPRQFIFHPSGEALFVLHELKSLLTVWRLGDDGQWRLSQSLSSLPEDVISAENYPSGLAWHPSGKFLYLSNRGHDSLAWFEFDRDTVSLKLRGHVPACGRFPRHFAFDPSGTFLLVANQKSDAVATFRIDVESGRPVLLGEGLEVATPACILISDWP